jgi:hypothetical protein
MSNKVRLSYLSQGNRYFRAWGEVSALSLRNRRGRMSHSLTGSPVFIRPPVETFFSWEAFVESSAPSLNSRRDAELMALYDEDCYWPQPMVATPYLMGDLHEEVISSYEVHYQRNGVAKAQKGDNASPWLAEPLHIAAAAVMILFGFGGLLLIVNEVLA